VPGELNGDEPEVSEPVWSFRIRLLETDYFAAMLVPPFHPSPDWAETLASSLLRPKRSSRATLRESSR
jgi:uncharacterized membrane protein